MSALLEARNLRVDYGRTTALRGFSLTLSGGELLGLVGPNGAGKTTAMRAMAGMLPLTTGSVRLCGQKVAPGATPVLSQIGFTPDTPAAVRRADGGGVSRVRRASYGLSRSTVEERSDYWLEQLWLTEKRTARISSLSRGMRQRLNVARTLLPNPLLILLDEPAAGLDPAGRVEFRRVLASLRDQGRALVVSSHILADLHEYCTHIAIMERGVLRQVGSVASVVSGSADHRCRYRGRLAAARSDLPAWLSARPDVSHVESDGSTFSFEYHDGESAAAELLRELIAAGMSVSSFGPLQSGLEEAYLRAGIRQVD
ncbi:MAG: ABC transporter ATP-binding protein [Phycisphaerae bacterium]